VQISRATSLDTPWLDTHLLPSLNLLRGSAPTLNYPGREIDLFAVKRRLPKTAVELAYVGEVAAFIAQRFMDSQSGLILRYGDTSGRLIARPDPGSSEYDYLKSFLGSSLTPSRVDYLADLVERSIEAADVIGLRSDLLGPDITPHILEASDADILSRLVEAYPIREFEKKTLSPDSARRLAQTRKAMELFNLPTNAILTDAWVHVSLAEAGFLAALMNEAQRFSVITSTDRRSVVQALVTAFPEKVRHFECPCYPWVERLWGGDHSYLWQRWINLVEGIEPSFPGEPLFVSAGIWTKVLGPSWAAKGGIAIDTGSVMDYLGNEASRPAVLATRYGHPALVPEILTLDGQLRKRIPLSKFLI
jgi:hypothetical protein